jgi:hypothetical protein
MKNTLSAKLREILSSGDSFEVHDLLKRVSTEEQSYTYRQVYRTCRSVGVSCGKGSFRKKD